MVLHFKGLYKHLYNSLSFASWCAKPKIVCSPLRRSLLTTGIEEYLTRCRIFIIYIVRWEYSVSLCLGIYYCLTNYPRIYQLQTTVIASAQESVGEEFGQGRARASEVSKGLCEWFGAVCDGSIHSPPDIFINLDRLHYFLKYHVFPALSLPTGVEALEGQGFCVFVY